MCSGAVVQAAEQTCAADEGGLSRGASTSDEGSTLVVRWKSMLSAVPHACLEGVEGIEGRGQVDHAAATLGWETLLRASSGAAAPL